MPLILNTESATGHKIYLWKKTEDDSFFYNANDISDEKWAEVSEWHPKRRSEWLAGRHLILKYAGCSSRELSIDQYGKPYVEHSDIELSISHSHDYVAIAVDSMPIGIDIQIKKPSIVRIAKKFTTSQEQSDISTIIPNELDALHHTWNLKEAIYKAYGRRQLDFKEHIKISTQLTTLRGYINKDNMQQNYMLERHKSDKLYIGLAKRI